MLRTDMSDEMVENLKGTTTSVFDQHKAHKDIATNIKNQFDAKYPPTDNKATSGVYHCIVGTNFACSVTHETHCSAYWECDNVKLLLFKSKDSPFD